MEDEDVEGQVTDAWTVGADVRTSQNDETLKRSSNVFSESDVSSRLDYNDAGVEENKEDRCSSEGAEDPPAGKSTIDGTASKIVFKGFKKRILAQAQENQIGSRARGNTHETNFHAAVRGAREKRGAGEGKRGKITEYAQYLGLQPAASNNKTKCARCSNPAANSCAQSMNKSHQCTCGPGSTAGHSSPGTSETTAQVANSSPSAPSAANNFRITRKVYLCAACGTYFENWNLFLHMREIHKRHICLFCLGMFGQAERLSYHLAKKHSVPENSFNSVEDFYSVFKGSCYLICCTCEKVFSETDNFYNHFCSPVQKSRSSVQSQVCSICRQSGGHSATCSLNEATQSPSGHSGLSGIQGVHGKDSPAARNKRMLKNNRLKRTEESLLASYQQKLSDMYARKMNAKSRDEKREGASSGDDATLSTEAESVETAAKTMATTPAATAATTTTATSLGTANDTPKSPRDTVSETIMEVSKCTEDSRGKKTFSDAGELVNVANSKNDATKIESSPCPTPSASPSRSPSPLRRQSDASLFDSVAETIMRVSRCSDYSLENTSAEDEENNGNETRRRSGGTESEADLLIMDDVVDLENDGESGNSKEDYDDRLKGPKSARRKNSKDTQDGETTEVWESDEECSSNPSPAASPPRVGGNRDDAASSSPEKESQKTSSVSFTTVNATDRSLVIKICTNRNSQFSVTSANGTSYNENHDTSRESEENNNGDDSASEKHSNHSGGASANSYRGEEDEDEQSDSDSGKLAVVDEEKSEATEETSGVVEVAKEETQEADEEAPGDEKFQVPAENKIEIEDCPPQNAGSVASAVSETREEPAEVASTVEEPTVKESDGIVLAAEDVPSIDLNVEGLLDSMEIVDLLKRCVSAASSYCVYCNHARHIAVNGKQLGIHVLAEHRFQPQHPAIIIQREQFTARVKKSIDEIESRYFNLDSFDDRRGTHTVQNPRVFECFHCRFHSLVHKDIYLHNRKMHQKTILICIMCKSTFYSYSELLCHLCPGVYSPNVNVTYRCCLCTVSNLPSAFRLMVHLRKRHHSCDVCLESTGNQQRLSNHVWKHKLHHLCYRCGIAYRNKPDITKHLFWKHGTESVLCKKCLQKKWPHVYHFCIPPTAFVCEECTSSFSRAVALKVHKRLHSGDRPYGCNECAERFISRKLVAKHEASHREPEKPAAELTRRDKTPDRQTEETKNSADATTSVGRVAETEANGGGATSEAKEPKEIVKKVVDVYDLPPLNLSSESDSDAEDRAAPETAAKSFGNDDMRVEETSAREAKEATASVAPADDSAAVDVGDPALDPEINEEVKKEEAQIMDGIWDNFKSYAASLEKPTIAEATDDERKEEGRLNFLREVILADHDYCVVFTEKPAPEELKEDSKLEDNCGTMEGEHDYGYRQTKSPSAGSAVLNCDSDTNAKKKKEKSPKKRKRNGSTSSSDSSSDSDTSSCSCGTNCSCSSSTSGSSSSSSSSSDSDSSASENSPRKTSARRERRKEKEKEAVNEDIAKTDVRIETLEENPAPEVPTMQEEPPLQQQHSDEVNRSLEICEPPRSPTLVLRESDLDTDETETDEDFYDEHPQQLANKLLAEKRNQLMLLAAVAPASNESTVPAPSANSLANNLNNGTLDTDAINANSLDTSVNADAETRGQNPRGQTRKRLKTKKRKKADKASKSGRVSTPTVESIKLNIPKSFYQKKQTGFGASTPALITVLPSRSSTPNIQNSQPEPAILNAEANKTTLRINVGGSGSENENKRSSKRKRVPKRFYGDSSDEEADRQQQQQQEQQLQYSQPSLKWRKVENQPFVPSISIKTQAAPSVNYPTKNVTLRLSGFDQPMERIVPMNANASESEEQAESTSAESSEADEISAQAAPSRSPSSQPVEQTPAPQVVGNLAVLPTNSTAGPERNVNLYCYCQCPYDEVSEMIACDGDDCRIEWFHFECVGIMVPPKGKWYCPDCRKKDGSLPTNEDYFD